MFNWLKRWFKKSNEQPTEKSGLLPNDTMVIDMGSIQEGPRELPPTASDTTEMLEPLLLNRSLDESSQHREIAATSPLPTRATTDTKFLCADLVRLVATYLVAKDQLAFLQCNRGMHNLLYSKKNDDHGQVTSLFEEIFPLTIEFEKRYGGIMRSCLRGSLLMLPSSDRYLIFHIMTSFNPCRPGEKEAAIKQLSSQLIKAYGQQKNTCNDVRGDGVVVARLLDCRAPSADVGVVDSVEIKLAEFNKQQWIKAAQLVLLILAVLVLSGGVFVGGLFMLLNLNISFGKDVKNTFELPPSPPTYAPSSSTTAPSVSDATKALMIMFFIASLLFNGCLLLQLPFGLLYLFKECQQYLSQERYQGCVTDNGGNELPYQRVPGGSRFFGVLDITSAIRKQINDDMCQDFVKLMAEETPRPPSPRE